MFGHCNNNFKRGRSNAWNIIFLGKGGCPNNWMLQIIRLITVFQTNRIY